MELTATAARRRGPFGLTRRGPGAPEVKKRIQAEEAIVLHPIDDEKKLPDKLAELALSHKDSKRAVLVFAQDRRGRREGRGEVAEGEADPVEMLTGTMRGKERDELVGDAGLPAASCPEPRRARKPSTSSAPAPARSA